MAQKKRIGVIGCGQWGPNQIRTFFFHPGAELRRICDRDPKRLNAVGSLYAGTDLCADYREITRADDIDAVVVATPVATHGQIVSDALAHSKDVLCEKPLTRTAAECRRLARLASAKRRIFMVGHVFLYNPGILKLKEII
ncbi:MAG: Gfo/Idh/MocA family oxidoreductase, partial [Candidatus Omnitrophica bacterium]|nr:Gfo/Idh/MocA family oxidoreductase [Candidatus Omnitrophota bacterium]